VEFLTRHKGVHLIPQAFEELRKKYDMALLLIGGTSRDPLYRIPKKGGSTGIREVSDT
jgi:hypothetical protein